MVVWFVAAFLMLGVLSFFGPNIWRMREEASRLDVQIEAAKKQLEKLRTPQAPIVDPRQASATQAARLLQMDLNKVFATVENLKLPGVRLRVLDVDTLANTVRLEYEFPSLVEATEVTDLLNAGYERAPWQLHSVVATTDQQRGVQGGVTARGVWSAKIDSL